MTNSDKRIIFCDNSLRNLLNFRGDIIHYYATIGYNITLIAPLDYNFENNCQNIHYLPIEMESTGMKPVADLKYFFQLLNIYRKIQPNIIFHYTIKPNIYGSFAAKILNKKSIAMVAGLGYVFSGNSIKQRLGRVLYKLGLRSAYKVLLLNQDNFDRLKRGRFIRDEDSILMPGGEGVNLEHFPYVKNNFKSLRFLMIARVLYDKGYSEFVEAAQIVKQKYPNIEFELLGPLAEKSPTGVPRTVIEKDTSEGKIHYLGATDHIPIYLSRDGVVVVLVSYHEGFSRSLMEACAMARPCITSNIPGCKEVVVDGVNGYLVPPKDVTALVNAMLRFIQLSQLDKQAMAEASYRMAVEKYDVNKVIEVYIGITENLL